MKIKEFLLERYFAIYEFSAPYLLCSSDCQSLSISELLDLTEDKDAMLTEFMKLGLGYTESQGNPILKQEIAKLYSDVQLNQILVCAGAQEAIFLVWNSLLQPTDHVIVMYPCYQSLTEIAVSIVII